MTKQHYAIHNNITTQMCGLYTSKQIEVTYDLSQTGYFDLKQIKITAMPTDTLSIAFMLSTHYTGMPYRKDFVMSSITYIYQGKRYYSSDTFEALRLTSDRHITIYVSLDTNGRDD